MEAQGLGLPIFFIFQPCAIHHALIKTQGLGLPMFFMFQPCAFHHVLIEAQALGLPMFFMFQPSAIHHVLMEERASCQTPVHVQMVLWERSANIVSRSSPFLLIFIS